MSESLPGGTGLQPRLVRAVQQELDGAATPGASLVLLLDGQPVLEEGIGFCDLERKVTIDPGAQFYIYSLTKTLLAAAVLQLVEQGSLALEAAVQEYLPHLPLEAPVTIRQLLNHSGGIPDYGGLPAYDEALKDHPAHPWSSSDFLAATLSNGLLFPPEMGWSYSNIGYLILRQLIEKLTESSLQAALFQQIFEPLGLKHTFVAATLEDAQRLTPGYSLFFNSHSSLQDHLLQDHSLQDIAPLYHPGWVSHGVVISTAPELAGIFEALFTGRLLPSWRLAEMLEPFPVPTRHPLFQQPAYGLGLMLDLQSRYGLVAGHAGGGPGYAVAALCFPNVGGRRITSVALANRDQDDLGLRLAFTMAELLAGELAA